jgi:hypothetical protein
MKDNFFNSMMSEGGKISHKRWISVTIAAVLTWVIVYATLRATDASERLSIIWATMAFILIMAGVTTVPQIIGLWKGTPVKEDDDTKPTT